MADKKNNIETPKQKLRINPALKNLEIFVGEWEMEISNASFLSDPSATLNGFASIEWFDGGSFLIIRQRNSQPVPPFSTWIIGRDESIDTYKMLYFDSRGVSRIYEMSFNDGLWKIWRNSPGFSQRLTGNISKDGNTILAAWEISTDDSNWEHDFDLTYRRRGE